MSNTLAAARTAAVQRAEASILRYVRLTNFHAAEEATAREAINNALVMLEEDGPEAVIDHRPEGAIEAAVWRVCAMLCRRAMLITRTPAVNAYFQREHVADCGCAVCD